MPFDNARYQSLIERASFRFEPFRGTIQDLSSAQRTMSFVGSPSFCLVNGLPALRQNAAGDGATSGAVAAAVDVTGSYSIEILGGHMIDGIPIFGQGASNAGGFAFYYSGSVLTYKCVVEMYSSAGPGVMRNGQSNVNTYPMRRTIHTLISVSGGGATGTLAINGVPSTFTMGGAGVVTNIAANRAITFWANTGRTGTTILRLYPFALTNSDATCLYGAARSLVGDI
jgi:hypothetical protein